MGCPVRSKKMAISVPSPEVLAVAGHRNRKMVRIGVMANRILRMDRRELLAGLGTAVLSPGLPRIAAAQGRRPLALQAQAGSLALRPGAPESPIWSLQGSAQGPARDPALRFRRGDQLEIELLNDLPVPTALNWHGLDGIAAAEPLMARSPLASGARENLAIPLRHAGTLLCDIRLLGDGQARPSAARTLIVAETEAVAVDRDEAFLIEDWRLGPDGSALAPGTDPKDMVPIYTINGLPSLDIPARTHERLRLRFVNGCQRSVIAIKMEGMEVRVMALDSQPSEPFPARNSAVVLAPGGRADIFVDAPTGAASSILLHDGKAARPIARLVASGEPPIRPSPMPAAPRLPSNGLPEHIELKNALRVDLTLGGSPADWVTPARFASTAAPAFRAKAGRPVVLALANRGAVPTVFHLHGHHFRLLDRFDDGWKPFWLDTLAIEPGQTQRIAFAAEHAGRWLIESFATDWAAPRLVRWYAIEN
jgi:FtsP/CotA-like multicopper oxidase with cupredoxin domain